jgi:molybdenum cofactor cytidylyltransferase
VQPTFEGVRGHPVLFARALFPELLEEALPEGARTVLRRYLGSRLLLPVDDPGILADIDTPEDYRRRFP